MITPLTREKINEIWKRTSDELPSRWANQTSEVPFYVEYARELERAHGIGESK